MSSTLYVGSPSLYLSGSGVIVGATSITLTSFEDIYGNVLTMADFGDLIYFTCEPDTNNAEFGTASGLTVNANGTYTLTGVKTGLAKSAYTTTSGLVRNHAGGTKVVITDSVQFWDTFVNKNNDSTVVGKITLPNGANRPVLLADTDTATTTALITFGQLNRTAIAGGTVASNVVLGYVALSAASASTTFPVVVETADTRVPTQGENDALVGTSGTPSSSNKYVTDADTSSTSVVGAVVRANASGKIDSGYVNVTNIQVFSTPASTSWTKPTNALWVEVTVIGAGGGGASGDNGAGGGGGGGYGFQRFNASALGSTETVIIGAGGIKDVNGGHSLFGTTTLLRANGGSAGTTGAGGAGGGANGQIHYTGGAGGGVNSTDTAPPGVDMATGDTSPRGGGGAGYNGGSPTNAATGGAGGAFTTYYVKAGGAGGANTGAVGTAASSTSTGLLVGGVGGGGGGRAASSAVIGGGGAGNLGGGGGGGGVTNGGGTGGDGLVVVVTYF